MFSIMLYLITFSIMFILVTYLNLALKSNKRMIVRCKNETASLSISLHNRDDFTKMQAKHSALNLNASFLTKSRTKTHLVLPVANELKIAICTLSKSRKTWKNVRTTPFYYLFMQSIHNTTRYDWKDYKITLHVGVDSDDEFWVQFQQSFVEIAALDFGLTLIVHNYAKQRRLPFNELMHDAAHTGVDFLVRLNDDTEILTIGWIRHAVKQLESFTPRYVGVVGPFCSQGKTEIMTHDMVHRTHLDIFGTYYPETFTNWYVDDWMSAVYGPTRTRKIKDWRVWHHVEYGTRYTPVAVDERHLQNAIVHGALKIKNFINKQRTREAAVRHSLNENEVGSETKFSNFITKTENVLEISQVTCSSKCVILSPFGRFNNNMIQLLNTLEHQMSNQQSQRFQISSIVLHEDLHSAFTSNFNLSVMKQLCIFSQDDSRNELHKCNKLNAGNTYYNRFQYKPLWKDFDRNLMMTWLFLKGTSNYLMRQFEVQSKTLPHNYIAIHARFLEGECQMRYKKLKQSTEYCDFKQEYLRNKIQVLGAEKSTVVICWDPKKPSFSNQREIDRQREIQIVKTAAWALNASISENTNIMLDMLLMLNARYFLGNQVSTVSSNVYHMRKVLYGHSANSMLI